MTKRARFLMIPVGVVALVCAVPVLLMGALIGTRLLGAVAGPVNIWNTTWHVPVSADMAGYYVVGDVSLDDRATADTIRSGRSGFRLYADHRLEVFDLPEFESSGKPGTCLYNGTGVWRTYESFGVRFDLDIRETEAGSCGATNMGAYAVLGHSAPYRIWYTVGDPDNDTGILYVRRGP